jgi:hypothetical protein
VRGASVVLLEERWPRARLTQCSRINWRYAFYATPHSDPSRFITLFNQMVQACQATR